MRRRGRCSSTGAIIQECGNFFRTGGGYIEVETPMMHPIPAESKRHGRS